jgi:hypothetical protein
LVAALLAALEAEGKSTDYVPVAVVVITIADNRSEKWYYWQKYADTTNWCAGDFVAFDTFEVGDQIPNTAPWSPYQISKGRGAYNLQPGIQIPSTGKGGISGFCNVLKSSLTDAQIANIERVLTMMRLPNGNYRRAW